MRHLGSAVLVVATVLSSAAATQGAVTPITAPQQISNAVTINFDDHPDRTVANTLYQALGITFTRDDGQAIPLLDWSSLQRSTTSPPNVLATILEPNLNTTYVTHLNVLSASPLASIGAYVGNDQGATELSFVRLTAYDASNNVVGSVDVPVNNNTSVDQFVGLTSTTPFVRARFENFAADGLPSGGYSVVIDDLMFTAASVTPARAVSWGGVKQRYR
jgi:hypothetical protein